MIHQPSGGSQGMASDIEIQAKEILYLRHRLNSIMAERTGQTVEQIANEPDRTLDYLFHSPKLQRIEGYVRQEDTHTISYHLPLLAEVGVGKNWEEAH